MSESTVNQELKHLKDTELFHRTDQNIQSRQLLWRSDPMTQANDETTGLALAITEYKEATSENKRKLALELLMRWPTR